MPYDNPRYGIKEKLNLRDFQDSENAVNASPLKKMIVGDRKGPLSGPIKLVGLGAFWASGGSAKNASPQNVTLHVDGVDRVCTWLINAGGKSTTGQQHATRFAPVSVGLGSNFGIDTNTTLGATGGLIFWIEYIRTFHANWEV